jgi:hypothetical protein
MSRKIFALISMLAILSLVAAACTTSQARIWSQTVGDQNHGRHSGSPGGPTVASSTH